MKRSELTTYLSPSLSNFLLSEGWFTTPIPLTYSVVEPPPSRFSASSAPTYRIIFVNSGSVIPSATPGARPSTVMRYTPTLIQGINVLRGNKIDYTNPNLIAANTKNINFTPLGDYMALERLPFASTIGNKMQAQ